MGVKLKHFLMLLPLVSVSSFAAESQICTAKSYEMGLKYQQKSAEVMALQLQTYKLATEKLNEKVKQKQRQHNLAVILDIDESIVDNTALYARDIENCHDYTAWDTWDEWEVKGHPKLIPGAKAFLEDADRQHVAIYYVSDRTEKNKADTIKMLNSFGLPQVSDSSVLLDVSSKEQRRKAIMAKKDVIMLIGDSLPDFAAEFKTKKSAEEQRKLVEKTSANFGDSWFILPDAAYGSWTDESLTPWAEK